jgi:hypothetical protein
MPGLVPGIHDLTTAVSREVVDARDKPGHDGGGNGTVTVPKSAMM